MSSNSGNSLPGPLYQYSTALPFRIRASAERPAALRIIDQTPRGIMLIRPGSLDSTQQETDHPVKTEEQMNRLTGISHMVKRRIRFYERLTRAARPQHPSPRTSFVTLIKNASDTLARQGRTYTDQLRIAEALNLSERSQSLHEFIKQHNRMMHGLLKLKKRANAAVKSTNIDVLVCAELQLQYCRWILSTTQIWNSGDPSIAHKLEKNQDLKDRSNGIVTDMLPELLEMLIKLDSLLPHIDEIIEYENIGPDHDLATLGRIVTPAQLSGLHTMVQLEQLAMSPVQETMSHDTDRDHRIRCAICLDPYSHSDCPFQLAQCQHIVGQNCMNEWLNSTHELATSCPHCRALLCPRRSRRLKPETEEHRLQVEEFRKRIGRASHVLAEITSIRCAIFGREIARVFSESARLWLNEKLEGQGVEFRLIRLSGGDGMAWTLVRQLVM